MSNANDWLMGGGVKSATFGAIGARNAGYIVRQPEVVQQRDYTTGEPKFWDDGSPMQQLVVQLATDQRDPADAEDDGTRALYVKGQMKNAVRDAVRTTGAPGLEVGGYLDVQYVRDGEAKKRGMNPPKEYTAAYTSAANAALGAPGQAPAAPPAPTQAAPTASPAAQQVAQQAAMPQPAQPPYLQQLAQAASNAAAVAATPPVQQPVAPTAPAAPVQQAAAAPAAAQAGQIDPANLPPEVAALLAQVQGQQPPPA